MTKYRSIFIRYRMKRTYTCTYVIIHVHLHVCTAVMKKHTAVIKETKKLLHYSHLHVNCMYTCIYVHAVVYSCKLCYIYLFS